LFERAYHNDGSSSCQAKKRGDSQSPADARIAAVAKEKREALEVAGKPIIMGGEGYPFVFRSFDIIANFNHALLASRTSSPDYTSQKYWSEFGDFITFSSQPVPQQNKLTENWAIVRFP
jgi:hypothetical protein